jgi:hypothetical protein
MVSSRSFEPPSPAEGAAAPVTAGAVPPEAEYEPPALLDLGHVREVTLGSSSSGTADANSQYYW